MDAIDPADIPSCPSGYSDTYDVTWSAASTNAPADQCTFGHVPWEDIPFPATYTQQLLEDIAGGWNSGVYRDVLWVTGADGRRLFVFVQVGATDQCIANGALRVRCN